MSFRDFVFASASLLAVSATAPALAQPKFVTGEQLKDGLRRPDTAELPFVSMEVCEKVGRWVVRGSSENVVDAFHCVASDGTESFITRGQLQGPVLFSTPKEP